jgi:deoxycytidylate deaminase
VSEGDAQQGPLVVPELSPYVLPTYENPDLIIAWVGAMGTEIEQAGQILKALLRNYRYDYEEIHVSHLLRQDPSYINDPGAVGAYKYYTDAILKGNEVRQELGTNDALAQFAVREIAKRRRSRKSEFERCAYVIHSLKLPEEIECFRKTYGQLFYCVGIYSHHELRLERMTARCNETYGTDPQRATIEALTLLNKDEHEEETFGQNVRGAFVEADYYIRSDESNELYHSLERFLQLIFDEPFVSPTKAEVAMAHARSAALRSADLSRQVGAAVVHRDGRVLTTGCNDVPRAGGGQYWVGDLDDARDFRRREDINDRKKRESIIELAAKIDDYLRNDLQGNPKSFYNKELKGRLKGTRIDSILEFSRVVHAEMAAMNSSAIDTISIRDADLYCTTFPCHLCARQIINVGIRNVFYIEPYPKSLTYELFSDSVVVNPKLDPKELERRMNEDLPADRKVAFIPFAGVAPRRYASLFANRKRKNDDGSLMQFFRQTARPRLTPILPFHERVEEILESRLDAVVSQWQSRAAAPAAPPTQPPPPPPTGGASPQP